MNSWTEPRSEDSRFEIQLDVASLLLELSDLLLMCDMLDRLTISVCIHSDFHFVTS